MVDPETDATSLISAVGLSSRENQEPALCGVVENASGAKSSTNWTAGLCFCHTTRQSAAAQICPRPCGSFCQLAPEISSRRTIWPGTNPALSVTLTEYSPFTASAANATENFVLVLSSVVENSDTPTTINGEGLALTADWNGLAPFVLET